MQKFYECSKILQQSKVVHSIHRERHTRLFVSCMLCNGIPKLRYALINDCNTQNWFFRLKHTILGIF